MTNFIWNDFTDQVFDRAYAAQQLVKADGSSFSKYNASITVDNASANALSTRLLAPAVATEFSGPRGTAPGDVIHIANGVLQFDLNNCSDVVVGGQGENSVFIGHSDSGDRSSSRLGFAAPRSFQIYDTRITVEDGCFLCNGRSLVYDQYTTPFAPYDLLIRNVAPGSGLFLQDGGVTNYLIFGDCDFILLESEIRAENNYIHFDCINDAHVFADIYLGGNSIFELSSYQGAINIIDTAVQASGTSYLRGLTAEEKIVLDGDTSIVLANSARIDLGGTDTTEDTVDFRLGAGAVRIDFNRSKAAANTAELIFQRMSLDNYNAFLSRAVFSINDGVLSVTQVFNDISFSENNRVTVIRLKSPS